MLNYLPPSLVKSARNIKRFFLWASSKERLRREVYQRQFYSRDQLESLQLLRLQELVEYAYNHVPFYRNRFENIGLEPDDIKTIQDFQKIPFLTKEEVRNNKDQLLSHRIPKIVSPQLANTGGSTGIPLQFYREDKNLERDFAISRSRQWYGYTTGERSFHIWAKYNEPSRISAFTGYAIFNAFDVTEENLHEAAEFLTKFKPFLVFGYVSTLVLFTEFLKENNYQVFPKAVETTAETLLPQQRQLLEDYYRCPVIDFYGCNEIYLCACQCGHNPNLHWIEKLYLVSP